MSWTPSTAADLYASIDGPFRILPVIHDRLEYADLVRLAFAVEPPDAVIVEVPSALGSLWNKAIDRLPMISVIYREAKQKRASYLLVQPADPLVEASRHAVEHGLPLICADRDSPDYGQYRDRLPDSYALWRIGPRPILDAFEESAPLRDPLDDVRERAIAWHAQRLADEGSRKIAIVCGLHHARGIAHALRGPLAEPLTAPNNTEARLLHLHPESLDQILTEPPFYVAAWEARRKVLPEVEPKIEPQPERTRGPFRILSGGAGAATDDAERSLRRAARAATADPHAKAPFLPGPIERLRLQWALLTEAEQSLEAAAPDEEVLDWQKRNLARYSRNLARLSGKLAVDLYDLVTACRGCVSENYAFEVLRYGRSYPAQIDNAPGLPTARITAEDLYEGVRRIRLEPRRRQPKRGRWWDRLGRKRKGERYPGEWLEGFEGEGICSYPPEDAIIETFGHWLRRKGRSILSEERTRVLPFTSSILDGIDLRETIRHWHEKRLWVREIGRVPGGVDSVVVIFDEDGDQDNQRFPYHQTWLGENDQESDMAFYSTEPAEGIVGPGICRVTYGGLVLCSPPRRMADVWSDPDYHFAESRPEVLLLAAMDYAVEKNVVYAAPKAPQPKMFEIARRLGLRLLYVPTGSLSRTTMQKIRVMHILASYATRKVAKDYLW
jgi:hypothetical protein